MISFLAYHGDAELRRVVIDRIARCAASGDFPYRTGRNGRYLGLVETLARGSYDLSAAHRDSGFPVPLLLVSDAVCVGLTEGEASEFILALAKAAAIDADLGSVAWDFLHWMFDEAVAELGPSRVKATAREAGHIFKQRADASGPTPTQVHKAKALAKRARRRGLELPDPTTAQVATALGAALDRGGEFAGYAVHRVAALAEKPEEQYRRYARKLLELVEAA